MKPNPPIHGHTLLREGKNGSRRGSDGTRVFTGGCVCGAHPGELVGVTAMRRWHRQHKAEVRSAVAS